MLSVGHLRAIALARRDDAIALSNAGRNDGAAYLCGYAVEVALKARICQTLSWPGFPSTKAEFSQYQSFRTHDLDVLLRLSGVEATIKSQFLAQWSVVVSWDPEARYRPIGSATPQDVVDMISSVTALLAVI